MLSGRHLCDELITRPEESYRLWCVVVCDLEKQTSLMIRSRPTRGLMSQKKKKINTVHIYQNMSEKMFAAGGILH